MASTVACELEHRRRATGVILQNYDSLEPESSKQAPDTIAEMSEESVKPSV